jgi:hypothetical protein
VAETYNGGITLSWPSAGERNWEATFRAFARALSDHNHDGNGRGTKIAGSAIDANGVGASQIRLENNQFLRGRNATNTADVNIVRVTSSNQLELGAALKTSSPVEVSDSLSFSGAANYINATTFDAADNSTLSIFPHGGTAGAPSRGASIFLGGNESAFPGRLVLQAGIATGAKIQLRTEDGNPLEFVTNGANRWAIDSAGHYAPAANNSYDLGTNALKVRTAYVGAIRGVGWEAWTPTWGNSEGSGNVPVTVDKTDAGYCQVGDMVFFYFAGDYNFGAIGGGQFTGTALSFSLPVTGTESSGGGGCYLESTGNVRSGVWRVNALGTNGLISIWDGSQFPSNVSGKVIYISGVYRAA